MDGEKRHVMYKEWRGSLRDEGAISKEQGARSKGGKSADVRRHGWRFGTLVLQFGGDNEDAFRIAIIQFQNTK